MNAQQARRSLTLPRVALGLLGIEVLLTVVILVAALLLVISAADEAKQASERAQAISLENQVILEEARTTRLVIVCLLTVHVAEGSQVDAKRCLTPLGEG